MGHPLFSAVDYSGDHGRVAHPSAAEDAAIAFDLRGRAEGFGVVVGELHGGLAIGGRNFADQTNRIEIAAVGGIASPKIIGQQGSPASAETNTASGCPLFRIVEIGGAAEVADGGTARQGTAKVSVQAEDVVDVEGIGNDQALVVRIAAASIQPCDIFIAADIWILAVNALAGPSGDPVGSVFQKLSGAESVGQHDAEFAIVGALPQLEDFVLRSFERIVIGRE